MKSTRDIIDVGPIASAKTLVSFITIADNVGTVIERLPDTKIYCRPSLDSDKEWVRAGNTNFKMRNNKLRSS